MPDRYRMFESDLGQIPALRAGAGFGAGSLVFDMKPFNRVLRFDPTARLIEVEAGMTLADLLALTHPLLVRLYLRARPLWQLMGRQFFIVGRKPAQAVAVSR